MVMVVYSALVRSHAAIYLSGVELPSFGLVRPARIKYTRSAVPQDVEGLTRPPRSAVQRPPGPPAYPVHARRVPGGRE